MATYRETRLEEKISMVSRKEPRLIPRFRRTFNAFSNESRSCRLDKIASRYSNRQKDALITPGWEELIGYSNWSGEELVGAEKKNIACEPTAGGTRKSNLFWFVALIEEQKTQLKNMIWMFGAHYSLLYSD